MRLFPSTIATVDTVDSDDNNILISSFSHGFLLKIILKLCNELDSVNNISISDLVVVIEDNSGRINAEQLKEKLKIKVPGEKA